MRYLYKIFLNAPILNSYKKRLATRYFRLQTTTINKFIPCDFYTEFFYVSYSHIVASLARFLQCFSKLYSLANLPHAIFI